MSTTTITVDPDPARLAQRLAQVTGKPVPVIVKKAIAAKAEAAGVAAPRGARLSGQALIDRMTEISEHCAALPVLDPRPADEIIGYGDFGLPR